MGMSVPGTGAQQQPGRAYGMRAHAPAGTPGACAPAAHAGGSAHAGAAGGVAGAPPAAQRFIGPDGLTYVIGPDGALYRAAQAPSPERKRRGALFWLGIIAALACLAGAAWLLWGMVDAPAERQGDLGDISSLSDAEIQQQIDDLIRDSMFNISIASQVDLEDGSSEGELKIENPASNAYLMRVAIVVEQTGQTIYETGIIEPNHHIRSDKLSVELPAGSYDCIARFSALDPRSEAVVGQASAKLKVNVKS